jgi:hypothetical protein
MKLLSFVRSDVLVGILGVFERSVYEPVVATVARVGLFKITAFPETALQSDYTLETRFSSLVFSVSV